MTHSLTKVRYRAARAAKNSQRRAVQGFQLIEKVIVIVRSEPCWAKSLSLAHIVGCAEIQRQLSKFPVRSLKLLVDQCLTFFLIIFLTVILTFFKKNKLAKARKTRTSPSMLGLKKFGLGKLWVKKVFLKYTFKNTLSKKYTFGKKTF